MPFQEQVGPVHGYFKSAILSILLLCGVVFPSVAAESREYAVEISVGLLSGPFAIQLSWPANDVARQYLVSRRRPGESLWGNPVATLPSNATGYKDTAVTEGAVYEYAVRMEMNVRGSGGEWLNAYGYVYAGGNVPAADSKGKALLVVDSTISSALANDLAVFQRDLIGAGWSVVRRDVSRSASPGDVRNQIKAEHNADPYNLRDVILIGHVPVPYSGNIAPDLHESHRGAWPADGFYGELDGTWTDSIVNVTSFDSQDNDNRPGDGKFDQSEFPSPVDLEVGRIDFWNLPAFSPRTEVDLLRNYFRKNHEFRHRGFTMARRGLVRDNFGDLDGDAPAVDAWRHYPQFFGPGNIREAGFDGFFPALSSESFLWSYGCGGGGFTKADGVGSTYDFAASDPQTVFLILHGSYFGDWNNSDNFLRAAVATPNYTLASIWSGLPHWFMHPMGLGANIGYVTRMTQNNFNEYRSHQNFSQKQVHVSLIGDPTLEMFPVVPPSNLTGSAGPVVSLNWNGASDENLIGYHVYYATNPNGPFQRLTGTPVNGTSYSHNIGAGTYYYMVRTLKLERTGSGTFHNLSQGITTTVTQGSGGTIPTVSISTTDSEASEAGADRGEFRFTRSGAVDSPLVIDILVGGTAQNGIDYQSIAASVTIPAGSAELRLPLIPVGDALNEGDETVTLQIRPKAAYTVGAPAVGFLHIRDAVINQPPVISPVSDRVVTTAEGAVTIAFQVSDPETAPESLNVRALSSNLSLVGQGGMVLGGFGANRTIRISPSTGVVGASVITLLASDGNIESSTTFNFTVIRPNLAPSAQSQNATVVQDTLVSLVLAGSDPEGAPLTFIIKASPGKGTLSGNPPNLGYRPFEGLTGQDAFTFSVSDGQSESTPATVTIQIVPTNRPPVALAQEVVLNEDSSVSITLGGSDPDGDELEFELVSGTTKGTLSGRDGTYSFMPIANVTGTDFFMFRASDGTAVSAPATVSITILPVNDAPTAVSATVQVVEDQPAPIILGGTDPDRDILTFQLLSGPTKGQIAGAPPNLTFTPTVDASGSDSFTFKVSDGVLTSSVATVSLEIAPVNDEPVALGQSVDTLEDVPIPILLAGRDRDGDALTFRVLNQPVNGVLSGTPPNLLFAPIADWNGTDSFTFVGNDGVVDSAPATITIRVEAANDPPAISPIAAQRASKNRVIGVGLSVEDADRPISELLVTAVSSATNVVRNENLRVSGEGTNRAVTITPENGATGTTVITLTVSDGEAEAHSEFSITFTNTPPVALPDAVSSYGSLMEIPAGRLISNDSDEDGDLLRVVSVSLSDLGQEVQLTNDVIVYRGEPGATEDSFDYTVEDSSGAQVQSTVTLIFMKVPSIASIDVSGSGIVLRLTGPPASEFRVQSSIDARSWITVGEGTTDGAGHGEFRATDPAQAHHRFYRAQWP